MLKYTLKNFHSYTVMRSNFFVSSCGQIISHGCTIFNRKYVVADLKKYVMFSSHSKISVRTISYRQVQKPKSLTLLKLFSVKNYFKTNQLVYSGAWKLK